MNEREPAKWLKDLAACYGHRPEEAAIARYLRILGRWKLTPGQWEELADRAVMRLTWTFPMPGELHDIAKELICEAELRENTERMERMRLEWEGRQGETGVE